MQDSSFTLSRMLLATADASAVAVPSGSEAEKLAIQRFSEFFSDLTPQRVEQQTTRVYASNAILHDTLVTHFGSDQIQAYLLKTAQRASGVKVRIEDVLRKGPDFYFRWSMDITWSAFRQKGKTTHSEGISLLRFNQDGQVILHHDFWDSAGGFFEHLPVVGRLIQWIKKRI